MGLSPPIFIQTPGIHSLLTALKSVVFFFLLIRVQQILSCSVMKYYSANCGETCLFPHVLNSQRYGSVNVSTFNSMLQPRRSVHVSYTFFLQSTSRVLSWAAHSGRSRKSLSSIRSVTKFGLCLCLVYSFAHSFIPFNFWFKTASVFFSHVYWEFPLYRCLSIEVVFLYNLCSTWY